MLDGRTKGRIKGRTKGRPRASCPVGVRPGVRVDRPIDGQTGRRSGMIKRNVSDAPIFLGEEESLHSGPEHKETQIKQPSD